MENLGYFQCDDGALKNIKSKSKQLNQNLNNHG